MKKVFFLFLLLFFINIDVYANTDLLELKVNKESVICDGYDCYIEIDNTDATITYKIGENVKEVSPSSGHKVSFDNEHSVQLQVTYNDSSVANYTLTIKKHIKSSDNSLSKLVVNDEEIELKEDVFVYSYETKFNCEKLLVKGEVNDLKASCSEKEYKFDLDKSSLSVEYPVKAENGEIRNYTIILKRKNKPDTTLKTLELSDIDLEFDPLILDYEVTIPYSVNTTKINAIANNKKALVSIKMEEYLIVGENIINVIVTNEEATDTYAIRINRLENMDESLANLESLVVKDYDLSFDPNILEYNLKYKEIPNVLELEYKSIDEKATITVLNNEDLKDKSVVSVKVLLENGVTRAYKLNILQEEIKKENKTLIIVLMIILIIVMIVLFILQLKEKRNNPDNKKIKTKKVSKKKEKVVVKRKEEIKEEEIEVI